MLCSMWKYSVTAGFTSKRRKETFRGSSSAVSVYEYLTNVDKLDKLECASVYNWELHATCVYSYLSIFTVCVCEGPAHVLGR